jgi:uncharacterized Tic20 family protein
MIILVSLLVALVGLFLMQTRYSEAGRIMFFCGLLATLLRTGGSISFLK